MNERELTGYPSIDKPWQQYYSEAACRAPLPACTVWENIYERNKAHPDDTALLYFGKKISYGKLFSEVESFSILSPLYVYLSPSIRSDVSSVVAF